jgi:hypothetical protein
MIYPLGNFKTDAIVRLSHKRPSSHCPRPFAWQHWDRELILLESDSGMMNWLQEWKRQILDIEAKNRFELWKDYIEAYEDVVIKE